LMASAEDDLARFDRDTFVFVDFESSIGNGEILMLDLVR
jgi:hypothetical protein